MMTHPASIFVIAFTASKTAVCMIAKARFAYGVGKFAAATTSHAFTFHSVTASARTVVLASVHVTAINSAIIERFLTF